MTEVRNAVAELGRLKADDAEVAALVEKVLATIGDNESRAAFVEAWSGAHP